MVLKESETGIRGKDLELVKDILITITKTIKTFNVYPKDNPIYQKFATTLTQKFNTYFESHTDLTLKVEQFSLLYEDSEVLRNEDKTDNISLMLFTDGIREISFLRGITFDEIIDFIDVLRLAPKVESYTDDIVTLLWEKNIQNITYTAVQEMVEETFVMGETVDSKEMDELSTLYGASYSELTIKPVSLDLRVEPVTDDELETIKTELLSIEEKSLLSSAMELLSELLSFEKDLSGLSELIKHIGHIMDILMQRNEIKASIEILKRLKEISRLSSIPEEQAIISQLVVKAGSTENLRKLFKESSNIEELKGYLILLEKDTLPNIVEMLGELQDRKQRKLLCEVLIEVGKQNIDAFSAALGDTRWYLVRNLVMILGIIKDPAIVKHIAKVFRHPEPRVRREAVRAIEGIQSEETKKLLLATLKDSDPNIRVIGLRALRRFGGADIFRLIKECASREALREKSFTEKKELLEALASLGGKEAFPILSELFKKRGLIEKDETTEIRACAAFGLGIIRTPEAISLLEKETGSRKSLLREACLKAIKESKQSGTA